jgi:cobalt/nickel transport protein
MALLVLGLLATFAGPATAHFNMLLPQSASGKKGEAVTLVYQWGHPFEHQLFDAPRPVSVTVLAPEGKKADLTAGLEEVSLAAGKDKKVKGHRLRFTPAARGDYVFLLQTAPIWMEDEKEFYQDMVKVVLHVQAQKNWDAAVSSEYEFLPLTRPYGLQAGMVFQAQLRGREVEPEDPDLRKNPGRRPPFAPQPGALVEIERYNPTAPAELPPDEQITRTAKTGPLGVVTATLPEAGWWCLTASRSGGRREHEGKTYPVRQRTTFWVYVDEKPTVR